MTTDQPITILFFDHTAKMGGGEIALYNLVTHLDTTRYKPLVVLASEGRLADRLRAARIELVYLPLDPAVVETRKESISLRSLLRVREVLLCIAYAGKLAQAARDHKAALIHCNSLKADLIGALAARKARIPCLWHIRDNINSDYLPGRVAAAFRSLARRLPTAIIANSHSTLEQLQLPRNSPRSHLYGVAYSGIPIEEFALGAGNSPDAGKTKNIVLVGRITAWKGQDIFIKAAAGIAKTWPQARFQIVGAPMFGEKEYEQSLRQLTKDLGVEASVEFLGFREDIPAILANAAIVVHASTLGEPFGRVVIEGMAAGKPVIATDGGALREIVVSGDPGGEPRPKETGILVPMGQVEPMAAAIRALLADENRARAMGEAGRLRAAEHFTIASAVRNVQAMYDRILGVIPAIETAPNSEGAPGRENVV